MVQHDCKSVYTPFQTPHLEFCIHSVTFELFNKYCNFLIFYLHGMKFWKASALKC